MTFDSVLNETNIRFNKNMSSFIQACQQSSLKLTFQSISTQTKLIKILFDTFVTWN